MRTHYTDRSSSGTGWTAIALTQASGKPEAGGLVLQEVRHDGHNLARDIRMLRMLLTVEVVSPLGTVTGIERYWFHLDDATFFSATTVGEHRPIAGALTGASDAVAPFDTYFGSSAAHSGYALRVEYTGHTNLFGNIANFEFRGMNAAQTFLFSHHGTSPPHEPSSALPAARIHPLLSYAMIPNPGFIPALPHRRLQSIRFDYRLHLALDLTHTAIDREVPTGGNNAGLFRDHSSFDVLRAAGSLISGAEAVVFEAIEKPVVLEVMGPGLAKGSSSFSQTPPGRPPVIERCWDNVHWWGSGSSPGLLPSAPGAFHAAHMHWRWGEVAPATGPQFGPGSAPAAVRARVPLSYGIMVDPRIWIQSIRVAVTLNDPTLDPNQGVALSSLSRPDWKTLFTGLRATPRDIYAPSDIVLWYSTEVHRSVDVPSATSFTPPNYTTLPGGTYTAGTEGVVFLHGLFFAHSAEQTGIRIGTRDPQHWPRSASSIRSAAQWYRPAS